MKIKVFAILIALATVSVACFAANKQRGKCGEHVKWHFKKGVLTISGKGAMTDYTLSDVAPSPWRDNYAVMTVVIQEGVTSIGDFSFYKMPNITSVTIPTTVTTIGSGAFWSCNRLGSVVIPESVTAIKNHAFAFCTGLKSVSIGSNVKTIEEAAFTYCTKLEAVTLPPSLTRIGKEAFENCQRLKFIFIPPTVTHIGQFAFYRCLDLQAIEVDDNNKFYSSKNGVLFDKKKTKLICCPPANTKSHWYFFPGTVKTIEESAFANNRNISRVVIPQSVTTIGDQAFRDCSQLTKVEIRTSSLTEIGLEVFFNCRNLTTVDIPDNLKIIGPSAFENCSKLRTLRLPLLLEFINSRAFANCTGLRHILVASPTLPRCKEEVFLNVPKDIPIFYIPFYSEYYTKVGKWFDFTDFLPTAILNYHSNYYYYSLYLYSEIADMSGCAPEITNASTDVIFLPNYARFRTHDYPVREIKKNAIQLPRTLETLYMPRFLTKVEYNDFTAYPKLKMIYLGSEPPKLSEPIEKMFGEMLHTVILAVPPYALQSYKKHSEWGKFQNIIGKSW